MKTAIGAMTMTIAIAVASSASAADYGAKGSAPTTTSTLPAGFGGATGGKLVVPTAAGTYPLIIASHGFSATSANQVGWAEHFASYGFVVAAPDFPSTFSPDSAKNRDIIKALVAMLPTAETPAKGRIDITRIGLEGHSAGGLATTLAAADLKPRATILFDPVDRDDLGKKAHATLCAPVLSIFANGSSCNNSAGWRAFVLDTKGPVTTMKVTGSTHCDGENADRGIACASFCGGGASPARQVFYARYATAFFLDHLKGDAAARATLAATALKAASGLEDVVVKDAPSCVTTETDAGTDAAVADAVAPDGSPLDSAVEDSATASDGSVTTDGAVNADTGAPEDTTAADSGCGCRVPAAPSRAGAVSALALALLALRRRR